MVPCHQGIRWQWQTYDCTCTRTCTGTAEPCPTFSDGGRGSRARGGNHREHTHLLSRRYEYDNDVGSSNDIANDTLYDDHPHEINCDGRC